MLILSLSVFKQCDNIGLVFLEWGVCCNAITVASQAEGLGFNPQCVHLMNCSRADVYVLLRVVCCVLSCVRCGVCVCVCVCVCACACA